MDTDCCCRGNVTVLLVPPWYHHAETLSFVFQLQVLIKFQPSEISLDTREIRSLLQLSTYDDSTTSPILTVYVGPELTHVSVYPQAQ